MVAANEQQLRSTLCEHTERRHPAALPSQAEMARPGPGPAWHGAHSVHRARAQRHAATGRERVGQGWLQRQQRRTDWALSRETSQVTEGRLRRGHKRPWNLPTDKRMSKMPSMHTVVYDPALKRKEILTPATMWMDLKDTNHID